MFPCMMLYVCAYLIIHHGFLSAIPTAANGHGTKIKCPLCLTTCFPINCFALSESSFCPHIVILFHFEVIDM